MAGSGVEALYDVIQDSLADPDLSASVGPPLAKRQKRTATATVVSMTAQESDAITPKPEVGASVSKEEIPAKMETLRINIGDTKWVYHCCVEGYTEGPSNS